MQTLIESQAQAGLMLFAVEEADPAEVDLEGAGRYKTEVEARLQALEEEAAKLTGKDNKKERAAKGKEIADLKGESKYVDACKVLRGLEAKHGFFVRHPEVRQTVPDAKCEPKPPAKVAGSEQPEQLQAAEKKEKEVKKAKKAESAGLSQAESQELDRLKTDIVARKTELKNQGLSGSQQNKDPQVVEWVTRMNELKEKAEPGSTEKETKKKDAGKSRAPLNMDEQREMDKLRGEVEAYRQKLRTEFGYSNKDIKADPELQEMEQRLAALEKRG